MIQKCQNISKFDEMLEGSDKKLRKCPRVVANIRTSNEEKANRNPECRCFEFSEYEWQSDQILLMNGTIACKGQRLPTGHYLVENLRVVQPIILTLV